jgi:4-hydroxy-3-methylbut-2-en-1-yl diphosphate reductase
MDTKAFRRSLNSLDRYHRQGFGHSQEVKQILDLEYQSPLIKQLRESDYTIQRGSVTIKLAQTFGFCWGVDRAMAIAYEARQQFPEQRIWITNEIIHNPLVNLKLANLGINFIPLKVNGHKNFSVVTPADIVILPAFGAKVQELQFLEKNGCTIVDTTCPWVSKVWHSVEKHKKKNFTSIIHGKYKHEETIATSSYAGTYLVILNLSEAEYVCNYILGQGNRAEFLTKFADACSPGFDPDRDLLRVGIANQTTMLKGETAQIGKLLERTLLRKYGVARINDHFRSFNTLCDATHERQDAVLELTKQKLDLMLVVGGFNSSNTAQLKTIASNRQIPAYHVDSADCLGPGNRIQHKKLDRGLEVEADWLPSGSIVVGVTSGASTPDKVVADVIEKIFDLTSTQILN